MTLIKTLLTVMAAQTIVLSSNRDISDFPRIDKEERNKDWLKREKPKHGKKKKK